MKTGQIKFLTMYADGRTTLTMKKQFTREEIIKMLRKQQGDRTQTELAKELGISKQFLADVFSGHRAPGEKLLSALGLTQRMIYEKSA